MKKFLIILGCVILYLASTVPIGLFLYTFKMDMGIDVFKRTGFHGFVACLQSESRKAFDGDYAE